MFGTSLSMFRAGGGAAAAVASTPGFTPASLPGLKYWHENDLTKLYSDAGTTLATDGGAVYRAADKGSNGYNLDQRSGQSSVNLPILHNPGGGVKPYLQFDGSNDGLIMPTSVPLVAADGTHWFALALSLDATTGVQASISGSNSVAALNISATKWNYTSTDTSAASTADNGPAAVTGTPVWLIAQVTPSSVEMWANGVSDGPTLLTGTRQANNAKLAIGGSAAITSYAQFKWYGDCGGTDVLTSTDRANLGVYLASLYT